MSATKQINVRLPLELHKALDDHRVRTGEQKSDLIRRGIELALGGGIASEPRPSRANGSDQVPDAPPPKPPRPASPQDAEDSVDLMIWLAGRTGMPRALCWRMIQAGRVTVAGHVWKEGCVSKTQLENIRLDGEPV